MNTTRSHLSYLKRIILFTFFVLPNLSFANHNNTQGRVALFNDGRIAQIVSDSNGTWLRTQATNGSWQTYTHDPALAPDTIIVIDKSESIHLITSKNSFFDTPPAIVVHTIPKGSNSARVTRSLAPRYVSNALSGDPDLGDNVRPYSLRAVTSPEGEIGIFFVLQRGFGIVTPKALIHVQRTSSNFEWNVISTRAVPHLYTGIAFSSYDRNFTVDIDSSGNFHLGFRNRGLEYIYLTNSSGSWQTETILSWELGIDDSPVESAALAFNEADQKPYAVSSYASRVPTGSLRRMMLRYHTKSSSGAWTSEVIADRSDGYNGGDGERGTGFTPELRFDSTGNAHLLFTDYASSHFNISGQSIADEFSGNLRYGTNFSGKWRFETIARQTNPQQNQLTNIALKLSKNEFIWSAGVRTESPNKPGEYLRQGTTQGRRALNNTDNDSDGLPDNWETQHFGNTEQSSRFTDSDGDSVPDFQEFLDSTNPDDSTNKITVSQRWAIAHGLEGNKAADSADPDDDGSTNLFEFLAGGNPTLPDKGGFDVEILSRNTPTTILSPLVTFPVIPARTYELFASEDGKNWESTGVTTRTTNNGQRTISENFNNFEIPPSRRFYRVEITLDQ